MGRAGLGPRSRVGLWKAVQPAGALPGQVRRQRAGGEVTRPDFCFGGTGPREKWDAVRVFLTVDSAWQGLDARAEGRKGEAGSTVGVPGTRPALAVLSLGAV